VSVLTDINNATLVRFLKLTEPEVEKRLEAGNMNSDDPAVNAYFERHTDGVNTKANLSEFKFVSTVINVATDYVAGGDYTYLLIMNKGLQPANGAQSMIFLRPTATSPNTTVNVPTGCKVLTFTPDLHSAPKLPVLAAGPKWVADWSKVTKNNENQDILFEDLDNLFVAYFAPPMTVTYLEENFNDLETLATSQWQIGLLNGQTSQDLSWAVTASGAKFTGFTPTDGVWVIGLRCTTCQSPAPVILSVLQPT
jgi:hypothetical protein